MSARFFAPSAPPDPLKTLAATNSLVLAGLPSRRGLGVRRWPRSGLGDSHPGSPEQPVVNRVAILESADDASGLAGLVLDLDDRFMQGGIEWRPERVDLSHAKPIERREEQTLRRAHAIEKRGLP